MSATEDRAARLAIAQELQAELRSIRERIHIIICHMLSDADSLKLAAADEVSRGEVPKTTAVTYARAKVGLAPEGEPQYGRPDTGKTRQAIVSAQMKVETRPLSELVAGEDGPAPRRKCSVCRQPGHRAKNCPNAHIVRAQKKAEVEARPVKRPRGPVSPERKAQLAETLKKARAARGKRS